MNKLRNKYLAVLFNLLIYFIFSGVSQAEQYFYFDCEGGAIGEELPHHQSNGPEFCGPECSGQGERSNYQSSGGTPQGNNFFQYDIVNHQSNHYTEIKNKGVFPVANVLGRTFYLAYYMRFDRIGGIDVWHDGGHGIQSADKGIELKGNGVRWVTSRGQWDSYVPNQDHRFTIWLGNPSYHLNNALEHTDAYYQNQNGYSNTNPIQLEYERWYSVVMGVKMACDNTGSVILWIDGEKILSYENIKTTANCEPNINMLELGGTMAQPAYDAPAHYRKFDALMLTDNWQDIVNGGYLSESPDPPDPPQDPPGSPPDFSANGN